MSQPFVLPRVANYPVGSKYHQRHWVRQVKCPKCGQACWAPGGYDEAIRKKEPAICQNCNAGRLF